MVSRSDREDIGEHLKEWRYISEKIHLIFDSNSNNKFSGTSSAPDYLKHEGMANA